MPFDRLMHAPAMPPCAVMAETAVDFISVYDAWSKREPAPHYFESFAPFGRDIRAQRPLGVSLAHFLWFPLRAAPVK